MESEKNKAHLYANRNKLTDRKQMYGFQRRKEAGINYKYGINRYTDILKIESKSFTEYLDWEKGLVLCTFY